MGGGRRVSAAVDERTYLAMDSRYETFGMPTAWRAFEVSGHAAPRSEFKRRLRVIEAGVQQLNLDPRIVHLAAESAALEPSIDSDDDRLALILLATCSIVALSAGSTRLPVTGPQSGKPLA